MQTVSTQAVGAGNRRTLWILLVVFFVPWLLGTALYFYFSETGIRPETASKGTLIDPARPLDPFALSTLDGEPFGLENLRGRWTLVHLGPSSCADPCQQNLYHMRQVRIALNKDMGRVQRLLVLTDSERLESLRPVLEREYPQMTTVTGSQQALEQMTGQFLDTGAHRDGWIYLVDPLGNLMMGFPPDLDPRGMLKDLRKLLKYSQIG
jgi:cytochrome oxidase Cu insertion factor (SCO1/SenC/PrrC family)